MDTKTLIDEAAKKYPSRSAFARAIGVTVARMNDWHSGVRACPVEVEARLCELAGMPEADAQAHIWRRVKALGKGRSMQGGGGSLLTLTGVALLAGGALGSGVVSVCALIYRMSTSPNTLLPGRRMGLTCTADDEARACVRVLSAELRPVGD